MNLSTLKKKLRASVMAGVDKMSAEELLAFIERQEHLDRNPISPLTRPEGLQERRDAIARAYARLDALTR